jgi:hypothetical protein
MPATAELQTMSVVSLRKLAKENGLTLPSNSRKDALVTAIAAATVKPSKAGKRTRTPAASPVVTTPPVTGPAKSSPVRKDVTPADVTPDNSARIAELTADARKYIAEGESAAMALAQTFYNLYPLKPWIAQKSDVHKFFTELGMTPDDKLPSKARKELSRLMFTRDASVSPQHVAWMSGAGLKTINSDKSELGLVSETRSAAQQANAAKRNAGSDETQATSDGPQTRAVAVYSMTGVRGFITSLTDDDMLEELADLITERRTALAAQAA